LEQRSEREVLGDINQGETVRKNIFTPMAFTPASVSLPSTSTTALVTDDDTLLLGLDPIAQAIAQAQEQLCLTMEVKQTEDLRQWMEKSWEEWISERDLVVGLLDKKLVREAVEHAVVVEIWKKWYKVSLRILLLIYSGSDLVSRS